jgi:hypothetical protein
MRHVEYISITLRSDFNSNKHCAVLVIPHYTKSPDVLAYLGISPCGSGGRVRSGAKIRNQVWKYTKKRLSHQHTVLCCLLTGKFIPIILPYQIRNSRK